MSGSAPLCEEGERRLTRSPAAMAAGASGAPGSAAGGAAASPDIVQGALGEPASR